MDQFFPIRRAVIPQAGADRRVHGRLLQQGVMCDLGVVIDLSASGMRVLATRRHRGELAITVQTAHEAVPLLAMVVWSRKVGFRRHMIGMRFMDVEADAVALLSQIAASHRILQAV